MLHLSDPVVVGALAWIVGMAVGGVVGWLAGASKRAELQTEVNGLRQQRQSGNEAVLDRRYADLVKARDLALEALAAVDRTRGRTFETGAVNGQGD